MQFFIFQLISEFGKNTTEKCWSDASYKSLSRNQGWELWNRPDRPPFSTSSMIHSFRFNDFVAKHKTEMREKYLLWSVRIQPFFVLKFIVWIFKQFDCRKIEFFDNLIKNSIISNLLYQVLYYNFESLIPILFEVIWIYTFRSMEIERSSPCFTTGWGSKEYAEESCQAGP